MGRRGAELLLAEIAGERALISELASVTLVIRRTT
jgi:DNA-binding LacI/PurR family transcriptional regulator